MRKIELVQILTEAKLLFGAHALTDAEVNAWFNYFGANDAKHFRAAMLAVIKTSKFFPTPGEIQQGLNLIDCPEILRITPAQALDYARRYDAPVRSSLIECARAYASRMSAQDPKTQYDSPEDLHRANQIQDAIWCREFKARFSELQSEVVRLMTAGAKFEVAENEVLGISHERATHILKEIGIDVGTKTI